MKKTNEMTVTGKILNLEEKRSKTGPFYVVNLETFYGPNIRFQAWNDDYEFIKRNQLRAEKEDGIGDYIDVTGYTHTYMMENKHGIPDQYVTFKTKKIRRPMARVTYSGEIQSINNKYIDTLSDQIGFSFKPDTPCYDNGEWIPANNIDCVIDKSNPDYEKIKDIAESTEVNADQPVLKAVISGSVDNTNKRKTKVHIDSLTLEEEDV